MTDVTSIATKSGTRIHLRRMRSKTLCGITSLKGWKDVDKEPNCDNCGLAYSRMTGGHEHDNDTFGRFYRNASET